MEKNCRSSHSRLPARRQATDPDSVAAGFQKDVAPHFVGMPPQQQMQQSAVDDGQVQQGEGNLVLDSNVGGFG